MNNMKISFKVEITGCEVGGVRCPFARVSHFTFYCVKDRLRGTKTAKENATQLTKTCPMVRAQFEALE